MEIFRRSTVSKTRTWLALLCAFTLSACDSDNPTAPSRAQAGNPGVPSGSGSVDARGTWEGTFVVDRCTGTGSVEDLTCRDRLPSGTSLLIQMMLVGCPGAPTGVLTLAEMSGPVTGTVSSSGAVTLSGSVGDDGSKDEEVTIDLTAWNTQLQSGTMTGTFAFVARGRTSPGEASGSATIRVLARLD